MSNTVHQPGLWRRGCVWWSESKDQGYWDLDFINVTARGYDIYAAWPLGSSLSVTIGSRCFYKLLSLMRRQHFQHGRLAVAILYASLSKHSFPIWSQRDKRSHTWNSTPLCLSRQFHKASISLTAAWYRFVTKAQTSSLHRPTISMDLME